MSAPLTAVRLREVMDYDPETGQFSWRISRGNSRAGSEPDCREVKGYLRISVDGRRYKAHRLAWLHVHGEWSISRIDHQDNDPCNNRINNLRLASNSENAANQRTPKNNTSGFKGVSKHRGKFVAGIKINYRRKHLGTFETAKLAASAYDAAAKQHFGEFAKLNGSKP